jgi:peroxiredoxin Q/BCP
VILGASFDTVEDNRAFAEAQQFGYRLLSDTSREVGEAYGVKKSPDEQWADFPKRITYLIDRDGLVRRIYLVTDVATNADEVLADIEQLESERVV